MHSSILVVTHNHELHPVGGAVTCEPLPSDRINSELSCPSANTLEARVDRFERRIIEDCLARNNFRRKETALELGISRVTLYNKMKKFGLM